MRLFLKCPALPLLVVVLAKAMRLMRSAADSAHFLWESALPTHGGKLIASTLSNQLTAFRAWNFPASILGLLVARMAQPKESGSFTLTSLASPDGITASLAHTKPILWFIFPCPDFLPALVTGNSIVSDAISIPIEVLDAESKTEVLSFTQFAKSLWHKAPVKFDVLRMVFEKGKVLWSIIGWITIYMVDLLWKNEKSSNLLFKNRNMFCNESLCIASGMFWHEDHHVSVGVNISNSFVSGFHIFGNISQPDMLVNTSNLTRFPT
jgi:hypothetical protein